MELTTPDRVIQELVSIRAEAQRGIAAVYEAEMKLYEAQRELELAEAKTLLRVEGNVAERNAQVALATDELRFAVSLAKAEYNRVRTKMKALENSQMSVQTQARLVELMYRSAGQGER